MKSSSAFNPILRLINELSVNLFDWKLYEIFLYIIYFSIFLEIEFERIHIIVEPKGRHRIKYVLSINGFPLFLMASIGGFTGDERDELWDTFLNTFFCVFGYFAALWNRFLHNSGHVCDWKEAVLFSKGLHLILIAPIGGLVMWSQTHTWVIVVRIVRRVNYELLGTVEEWVATEWCLSTVYHRMIIVLHLNQVGHIWKWSSLKQ